MSGTATPHRDRIPEPGPMLATRDRIEKGHEGVKIRGRTYGIGGIGRLNLKLVHGGGDCLCALEKVGVYGFAVCYLGVVREAVLVDDAHLLDNRRLARFARAWVTKVR